MPITSFGIHINLKKFFTQRKEKGSILIVNLAHKVSLFCYDINHKERKHECTKENK